MKRYGWIGLLFLTLLACHCAPESPSVPAAPQRPELVAIDTLMQSRPDSALAMLLAEPLDDPYYHLLLSEALYKNDSAQVNRPKLLAAMASFDSAAASPRSASQQAYLAARCHYMNGVGYYEMDSVVRACEQYMTALEIMEERFSEKDLVGPKAKFMALTYTHLTQLFSDQYLHEQAIFFGKRALSYYNKIVFESWHFAWILNEIGSHYEMMEQLDSAAYFYTKAMDVLNDNNSLLYRDISSHLVFLSFLKNRDLQTTMTQFHELLMKAVGEKERLTRCAMIAEIYYHESCFDSARLYLEQVFTGNSSISSKKQAAEWLVELCKNQGMSSDIYANYLVPFANQEENRSETKSQLTELYRVQIQKSLERSYQKEKKGVMKWIRIVMAGLMLLLTVFLVLFYSNQKKKRRLEVQMTTERLVQEANQKSLGERLKKSNNALLQQKEENKKLINQLQEHQVQASWDSLDNFMQESICREILSMLEGKFLKREAKPDFFSELWLNEQQLTQLFVATERHFNGFSKILTTQYPRINKNELNQCLLCLLNLSDVQIAALLHCDYSTIKKRSAKLKKAFETKKPLQVFIREFVL